MGALGWCSPFTGGRGCGREAAIGGNGWCNGLNAIDGPGGINRG
jgi:hypothetical protein